MKTPYWYQQDAINAGIKNIFQGLNTLIVAPTGAGKSVIAACFCEQIIQTYPSKRILLISSFEEILKQDYATIQEQLPQKDIGLYSAGCGSRTIDQITVAGIQSIFRKPQLFEEFDYVIIDEAHLVSFEPKTMYRKFLEKLTKPTLGLTATHFRLKGGYLHKGENAFFTDVAYEISIPVLQKEGKLCQITTEGSEIKLDASGIRKQAGDFVVKELSLEFDRIEITRRIALDLVKFRETRRAWLGFAIDIKHCEHISAELNALGIKTAALHSKLPKRVQAKLLQDYKNGRYQCLVSVAMLTTGFDHPPIDLIFGVRPTCSPVLHVQMPGRGMRVYPGKENLLYKDYTRNLIDNGPIDNPKVPSPGIKKKKGDPILKECEECFLIVPVSVRLCPRCGTEFKIKHKLSSSASKAAAITKGEWHKVNEVNYTIQLARKNRKPMLKVIYKCGLRLFNEYVLLEHGGQPQWIALGWWERRFKPDAEWYPSSCEEALKYADEYLEKPAEIYVDESGKYPQINDYIFKEQR